MITSNLRFPPVKRYGTLPDKLIYHTVEDYNPSIDRFIMFSTKRGVNNRVVMICYPRLIEREGKEVPSLYVWKLFSNCSGQGFGRAMIDFAKNYSKRLGCNGYVHLFVSSGYTPNRIPHIFYRKCGFSTNNVSIDSKLDKFIRKHKDARYLDFRDMDMFYPPIEHPKNNIFKNIFCKIFKV